MLNWAYFSIAHNWTHRKHIYISSTKKQSGLSTLPSPVNCTMRSCGTYYVQMTCDKFWQFLRFQMEHWKIKYAACVVKASELITRLKITVGTSTVPILSAWHQKIPHSEYSAYFAVEQFQDGLQRPYQRCRHLE